MNEPARVNVAQSAANLDDDLVQPGIIDRLPGLRHLQVPLRQAEQVLALHILHRVIECVKVLCLRQFFNIENTAEIVHLDQVRVVQLAQGGELVLELRHAAVTDVFGAYQLQGHHLVGAQRIPDQVHDTHAALAKFTDNAVAMVNGCCHSPSAPANRMNRRRECGYYTGRIKRTPFESALQNCSDSPPVLRLGSIPFLLQPWS